MNNNILPNKSIQYEENEKVALVGFVGCEDVLQHIVPLKEKKFGMTKLGQRRQESLFCSSIIADDDDDDDDDEDDDDENVTNSERAQETQPDSSRVERPFRDKVNTSKSDEPVSNYVKASNRLDKKEEFVTDDRSVSCKVSPTKPTPVTRQQNKNAGKTDKESEREMVEMYFEAQVEDTLTSDRIMGPRISTSELLSVLKTLPDRYEREKENLTQFYRNEFKDWMIKMRNKRVKVLGLLYACRYGYNILLHGVGSKQKLLESFRRQMLSGLCHIVINGYFPSLSINEVLSSVNESQCCSTVSQADLKQFIHSRTNVNSDDYQDWFLIVHSLDGNALRSEKFQQVFSLLSQTPGCHIIASVDHINSSLLWDQIKASKLQWLWKDVTTYECYDEESCYETSVLVSQSGHIALSSLSNIMNSLTTNARGIFHIIIQYQLDHLSNSTFEGITISDLYQRCRESFLVNCELALRTQLVEFKDHRIIRSKRSVDGSECLVCPLDSSTIQQYLSNQLS